MRASTVFVLALALLVGFVALAAAKSAGLFNPKPAAAAAAPPPPAKVLAAKVNMFEGIAATADQAYVRELRPEEEKTLADRYGSDWKNKVMQPLTSAVHLRTVKQNIMADTILFRDQFEDVALPDTISKQLEPNTRAVNVSVQKVKAAGGVLRVGEIVDVLLTSKVGVNDRDEIRTACIARGCKIVMKRNSQWGVLATDPDDKPLNFTLQANPYRAAVIEFAQSLGSLSLVPGSVAANAGGSYSDPSSKEYATEDQRIDEMVRGTRTIGTDDLVRIFQIPPRQPAAPVVPPKRVQHLSGVSDAGSSVFPGSSSDAAPAAPETPRSAPTAPVVPAGGTSDSSAQSPDYNFRLPSATGETTSGCKSCDEKKKKEAEAANKSPIRN